MWPPDPRLPFSATIYAINPILEQANLGYAASVWSSYGDVAPGFCRFPALDLSEAERRQAESRITSDDECGTRCSTFREMQNFACAKVGRGVHNA